MIGDIAKECLSCLNPLCEKGCPVSNFIRDFIKAVKEEDLEKAQVLLYEKNPFPAITCRVCAYEKQCEGHCVKGIKGNPVEIHAIECYISDQKKDEIKKKDALDRKIALVGAGIANLAIAKILSKKGYQVEIFEKERFIGGVMMSGIPSFRFPKELLLAIEEELKNLGVVFHMGTCVGKDLSLMRLEETFDRVVVGVGAIKENRMSIPGEEKTIGGLSFLYAYNILKEKETYIGKRNALVVGGGNVAIDCARSLKRMVEDVTLLYRRSEKEMPANRSEIALAKEEGIHFETLQNIKEIKEKDGIYEAHCIRMELGEKDESGRASFKEVEGSEFTKDYDVIVMAIGQKVDLSMVEDGLVVKEAHHTNHPHVYVTGDAFLGPSSVAACIGDAKKVVEIIEASF